MINLQLFIVTIIYIIICYLVNSIVYNDGYFINISGLLLSYRLSYGLWHMHNNTNTSHL